MIAYFGSCGGRVETIPWIMGIAVVALFASKLIDYINNNDKIKNKSKWVKIVALTFYGGLALSFIVLLLQVLYYGIKILVSLYQF